MSRETVALRAFRVSWACFSLALTAFPYFFNAWNTPSGQAYTWIVPPYPVDAYAYRAWAMQAFRGRWLFSLKFTALPNPAVLFLPFFLIVGKISRMSRMDIGLVFFLVRSVGVLIFWRTFFNFMEQWRMTPRQSVSAAIFAGGAAGFGGLASLIFSGRSFPLGWVPVDGWLVDSNTFWSLLWNPLYPYSLALILLTMTFADRAARDGDESAAWISGFCLGALALLHPYPVAVLCPLLVVLFVVRSHSKWMSLLARVIAVSIPAIGYVIAVSMGDAVVRTHNAVGTGGAVSMFAFVAGFGFLPWLAVAGAAAGGWEFFRRHWPLMLWVAISAALCLSPFWFRSKYIFGAHIPVCLLAGAAVAPLLDRFEWEPSRSAAAAALFLLAMPFTLFVHLWESEKLVSENRGEQYRISSEMKAGLDFLRARSRPADIVFADPETSDKICAFAGNTVYWGHWAQSVDFSERLNWIIPILAADSKLSEDQRRFRFWSAGMTYVFLNGSWRALFNAPPASSILVGAEEIYGNGEVEIYRRPGDLSSLKKDVLHESSAPISLGSPISLR